jgi:hypothetical protein
MLAISEARNQCLKSEVWSPKSEVRSPKSEVRSLKSLHGFRTNKLNVFEKELMIFYATDILCHFMLIHAAISIKVVHEQTGKVEYERERLLGIALKIH